MLSTLGVANVSAQWTDDVNVNNEITPTTSDDFSVYDYEVRTNSNGTTYFFFSAPLYGTISNRLQVFDKDGNAQLPDTCKVVAAEKNRTWTAVNQLTEIDHDGNLIISVFDLRSGGCGYTIYKYNEKGEELWNTQLNDGNAVDGGSACMSIACTSDGGYVFAYMTYNDAMQVQIEKLDKDGKSVWRRELSSDAVNYSYPHVVDCGGMEVMLVYAQGSNQDLYARMIDFSGEDSWDEPVLIYDGGFTGNPLHTMLKVRKGPDDGVIVAWMGWDTEWGSYEARMSLIKNDGTYGFASGEGGTVISNSAYSRGLPEFYYNDDDEAIYCVYQQFSQGNQSYAGLFAQKISYEGELMWGGEGKAIADMQSSVGYGYESIQCAPDGKVAIFYMKNLDSNNAGSTRIYNMLEVWDKDGNQTLAPSNFSPRDAHRAYLQSSKLIDNSYFLSTWREYVTVGGNNSVQKVYLQKVMADGTNDVQTIEIPVKTDLRYYNAAGVRQQQMQHGLNIVSDGNKTVKVIKK